MRGKEGKENACMFNFEKLKAWQEAIAFADLVLGFMKGFRAKTHRDGALTRSRDDRATRHRRCDDWFGGKG